jgi:hypothetical protein
MQLTDTEWRELLRTIKDAVEEIVTGSGYGYVTIECAAGAPRDVQVQRSLRFRRDICPDEDRLPQASPG